MAHCMQTRHNTPACAPHTQLVLHHLCGAASLLQTQTFFASPPRHHRLWARFRLIRKSSRHLASLGGFRALSRRCHGTTGLGPVFGCCAVRRPLPQAKVTHFPSTPPHVLPAPNGKCHERCAGIGVPEQRQGSENGISARHNDVLARPSGTLTMHSEGFAPESHHADFSRLRRTVHDVSSMQHAARGRRPRQVSLTRRDRGGSLPQLPPYGVASPREAALAAGAA